MTGLGLPARIESKISPEPMSGCWLWTAQTIWGGYGRVRWNGRKMLAHVAVFECVKGVVPEGLELDHTCRVRCCVNPDHLEPVTRRVNVHRGMAPQGINARKTHCKRGHMFTSESTYLYRGSRYCLPCIRAYQKTYRRKAQ